MTEKRHNEKEKNERFIHGTISDVLATGCSLESGFMIIDWKALESHFNLLWGDFCFLYIGRF